MGKHYLVSWTIDVFDADSPEEAAWKARVIQLDPDNIATFFDVKETPYGEHHSIDLLDDLDTE